MNKLIKILYNTVKYTFVLYFFYIFTKTNKSCTKFEKIINLNTKSIKPCSKQKNINKKVYEYYIHNKFSKKLRFYLSISYLEVKDKNIIIEFFLLIPFDGSKEIKLSKKEIMENEREWGISLFNNEKTLIKAYNLEKVEPNQFHINIFGNKKIKFGNLYKVSFIFPKEHFIFSDNLSLRFYQYNIYFDIKIKKIIKSLKKG